MARRLAARDFSFMTLVPPPARRRRHARHAVTLAPRHVICGACEGGHPRIAGQLCNNPFDLQQHVQQPTRRCGFTLGCHVSHGPPARWSAATGLPRHTEKPWSDNDLARVSLLDLVPTDSQLSMVVTCGDCASRRVEFRIQEKRTASRAHIFLGVQSSALWGFTLSILATLS